MRAARVRLLWKPCGRLFCRRVPPPRREMARLPLPAPETGAVAKDRATTRAECVPALRSCARQDRTQRKTASTSLPPDEPDDRCAHHRAKTCSRQRRSRPTYELHVAACSLMPPGRPTLRQPRAGAPAASKAGMLCARCGVQDARSAPGRYIGAPERDRRCTGLLVALVRGRYELAYSSPRKRRRFS